jgi:hypothetical protein
MFTTVSLAYEMTASATASRHTALRTTASMTEALIIMIINNNVYYKRYSSL